MSQKLHNRLKDLPLQMRAAKVDSFDYGARTVTFALTSEEPVERWYGDEILDHSAASVNVNRLKRGIPLLFNHNRDQQLGRIESYEIRDKKLYCTARFGNSALATEKLNDVRDGILVDTSAGYIPHDYEFTEGKSGKPDTIRWTNWETAEGSLVTVPADPTVGVGRDLPAGTPTYPTRCLTARAEDSCPCECAECLAGDHEDCTTGDCDYEGNRSANDVTNPAAAETEGERMTEQEKKELQAAAARAERERVNEINAIQAEHAVNFTREAADRAIMDGADVAEVRKNVLANQREAAKASSVRSVPALELVKDGDDKREKGVTVARTLRALAASKGDFSRAERFAREVMGDNLVARSFASAASSAVDGGFALQGTVSGEIIELLRPVAVVRSLGPNLVPLDGTYTQNRLTSGASGGYIGENQDIKASKASFGQLKLSAKKLAALLPISNDLLRRNGGAAADAAIREDLVISLANTEDVNFIRSQGSQYSPKGLRYWALPANIIAAQAIAGLTGNPLLQTVQQDLGKLKLALRQGNIKFVRPGYIVSPRTEYFLQNLLNGFGVAVFREEMATGKLNGYPYRVTTQIPENLTVNAVANTSELYFADFASVTLGEAPQIGIEFSTEASYIDPGSNSLVSAFSQDQTVMRVIMEHDLGMRHQEGLAILNQVTWGL